MPLQVIDCLSLEQGNWIQFETITDGTILVPKEHYKDDYSGITWGAIKSTIEELSGWAYRWYDSGKDCLTDNHWVGVYDTAQEAFMEAHESLSIMVDDEGNYDDSEWIEYAQKHQLDPWFIPTGKNTSEELGS